MNYCEQISYNIYTAEKDDFSVMVDNLLSSLPEEETIVRLSFFGMPQNNEQYLERRGILRNKITCRFGDKQPVLSYVSQPPLNGALIMEVHAYREDKEDRISFRKTEEGFPYVIIENGSGRFLFAGGFQDDIQNTSIATQSSEVFEMIDRLLKKEEFPINSIIRQWNYIEQITGFLGENQNYQSFNNARSNFYSKTIWDNGYPAATGIGTDLGGVLIDLDAALFTSPDAYATKIDNKLQIAAHAYSENVLIAAHKTKTTPKFERAKSMTFGDKRIVYVSGTAAIRGEESLKGVGLDKQLHITMENIAQLIDNAKPVMLRVYLKYKDDYEEAELLMKSYYPDIPVSYMCADVCRDELLIEIEGIAISC
ncbi:MAG: endoribonuclease L-PSP [Tannerellaceae bacterium]|nr:endoribonuclease L-PSP [Tannerellaceae bacterium]